MKKTNKLLLFLLCFMLLFTVTPTGTDNPNDGITTYGHHADDGGPTTG